MEESKALAGASLAPNHRHCDGKLSCWTRPPAHKRAPGTQTEHPTLLPLPLPGLPGDGYPSPEASWLPAVPCRHSADFLPWGLTTLGGQRRRDGW